MANNLGGMFAGGIERSWPGSWRTIALASVLPLRSPPPWASLLVVVSVTGLQLANLGLLLAYRR